MILVPHGIRSVPLPSKMHILPISSTPTCSSPLPAPLGSPKFTHQLTMTTTPTLRESELTFIFNQSVEAVNVWSDELVQGGNVGGIVWRMSKCTLSSEGVKRRGIFGCGCGGGGEWVVYDRHRAWRTHNWEGLPAPAMLIQCLDWPSRFFNRFEICQLFPDTPPLGRLWWDPPPSLLYPPWVQRRTIE